MGNIKPNFPPGAGPIGEFVFQSVDGGIVNNNPFDYAQYALFGDPAAEPASGQDVDRAIIMVAPFPEPPVLQPEGTPTAAVIVILKTLFPSLVNQALSDCRSCTGFQRSGSQPLPDRPVAPHSKQRRRSGAGQAAFPDCLRTAGWIQFTLDGRGDSGATVQFELGAARPVRHPAPLPSWLEVLG
jgi:hypothetical protein